MGFSKVTFDIGEQLLIESGEGEVCGVPCGETAPLCGESTIFL